MSPREKQNMRRGLLFLTPWAIGFLVFIAYPLVYSIIISFTSYTGMNHAKFIGWDNYKSLFTDPLVGQSIGNTLFYAVLAVPIGLVVSVLLALAMNRNVKEVAWYRTALYVPSLVPVFAMSFIFVVLVNPQYGIVNKVIEAFGGGNVNYLAEPTSAKVVIVVMAQLGAGNAALIFLAGLNNIPQTLYEAARIDGANPWQSFTKITLPLLTPAILFNLITGISGGLQVFTQAYIMTGGGPDNGTLFYMYYLYKNAFSYAQLGFASAMAVALFLFGMLLALLVFWVTRRFVNYDASAA
ncbi:sugar ABC transporter permease [Mangrovactinospora gilvigrisea]|uniref:Sugar ABC transporter permease n=1 Tax=Mangrovactinospora gilvigrisea TaxID=1428644 RepID=A0A1J7BR11_9ACTN|nr:sugar ABC transporter permease [Mangrovactinospora gilvigrisea]OIV35881.1 sugar ABC transporter permease [Mangrovactinospora gilvigrisea]